MIPVKTRLFPLALTLLFAASVTHAQDIGGWLKRAAKQVQDDISHQAESKVKDTVTRPVKNALDGHARKNDTAENVATSGSASNEAPAVAIAADNYLEKTCGGTPVAGLAPKRLVRADPNRPNIPAAELAAERKTVAGIDAIFAPWQPNGYVVASQVVYLNKAQGTHGNSAYGNDYSYTLVSYIYDCIDGRQWRKDAENGTFLLLFVNSGISPGVDAVPEIKVDDATDDRFGYYQLGGDWTKADRLPQAKNGYFEFTYDADGSTYFWFTRNGELPFQYVPRGEFIRRQIEILKTVKAANQKRMAAAQAQWAASGIKVPEATAAQNAQLARVMYDKPIEYYQQQLQKPEGWLQQPTYCVIGNDGGRRDYTRCDFLDAMQARAQVPIKPNPGYFDRRRSQAAPQYIGVDLRAYGHSEAAARQRALIEQNADRFLGLVR